MISLDLDLLVSVVVPTAGRPQLLIRAVESALSGTFSSRTEVVVVPNGADESWREVAARFADDARVVFVHCPMADQNVARNTGLQVSRGILIRFLDDDDYLEPEAAARQYVALLESDADFCSGAVRREDQDGRSLGILRQPAVLDPEYAIVGHDRMQIPLAHVYRRSSIGSLRWPVGVRQSEDIVWLINYVAVVPRKWLRVDDVVGVWYQHDRPRMSVNRPSGFVHEVTASVLVDAAQTLDRQGRLSAQLRGVLAVALWQCVNRAFVFRPLHWSRVAMQARAVDKKSTPPARIFNWPLFRSLGPLATLWLLYPKRLLAHGASALRACFVGWDYRRTL